MTRQENLMAMNGATLIKLADNLGVKVACNKTKTALKESKADVIEKIMEAESQQTETAEAVETAEENPVPVEVVQEAPKKQKEKSDTPKVKFSAEALDALEEIIPDFEEFKFATCDGGHFCAISKNKKRVALLYMYRKARIDVVRDYLTAEENTPDDIVNMNGVINKAYKNKYPNYRTISEYEDKETFKSELIELLQRISRQQAETVEAAEQEETEETTEE